MITAKIRCASKSEFGDGDNRQARVMFYADYADGANKEWAAATPSLTLDMTLNGSAADLFAEGDTFTLQFVKSE